VGSAKEKDKWIKGKVEGWVQDVWVMANVAGKYPQAVYIGFFVKCKQQEWQYVQRVVANIGHYFEPLEEVIRNELIPALLGLKVGKRLAAWGSRIQWTQLNVSTVSQWQQRDT